MDQDDIETDPGMGPQRIDLSDIDVEEIIDSWSEGLDAMGWGGKELIEEVEGPQAARPQARTIAEKRKQDGTCPDCGHRGEWKNLALVCPTHGKFMG